MAIKFDRILTELPPVPPEPEPIPPEPEPAIPDPHIEASKQGDIVTILIDAPVEAVELYRNNEFIGLVTELTFTETVDTRQSYAYQARVPDGELSNIVYIGKEFDRNQSQPIMTL